jgi:hypothetical protein
MRATIAAVTTVVAEITVRFRNGDPAKDALQRLQALVPSLVNRARAAGELPEEVRSELAALFDRVRAAVAIGDEWLARTEPELIALQVQKRLRTAYRVR